MRALISHRQYQRDPFQNLAFRRKIKFNIDFFFFKVASMDLTLFCINPIQRVFVEQQLCVGQAQDRPTRNLHCQT